MDGAQWEERKARLSEALFKIHRESKYYWGLTEIGEKHLAAGGSIAGPDGMPMDIGMNTTKCCSTCQHNSADKDHWPCQTVKLLLEAGVVSLEYRTFDEQLPWVRS